MTTAPPATDEHLTGLAAATDRLVTGSREAGLDAPVPTCPGWDVRDLLAHQGAIHRWATDLLGGADPRTLDPDAAAAEGRTVADPVAWVEDGAARLLATLQAAPDDLEAFTFLVGAGPARAFWARRQHHETAMHALDARAARDGRLLTAGEAWFGDAVALDGIDELLVGFWQRRTKGPRAHPEPYTVLVRADGGPAWRVQVGTERVVTTRPDPATDHPDADPADGVLLLEGSATDLYLGLWNRGGAPRDPAGVLGRWRGAGIR